MVRLYELENEHYILEIRLESDSFNYEFRSELELVEYSDSERKMNGMFIEIRDNNTLIL